MSNPDVSLVSAKIKQENEESKTSACDKQQQADVIDDHEQKSLPQPPHLPQTPTVKIAPRPANVQHMPCKDIITPLPPSCISIPPAAHTTLFPQPSTFLPGVDDHMASSPLPFNNSNSNQLAFLAIAPQTTGSTESTAAAAVAATTTATTATTSVSMNNSNYALTPHQIASLPVGSLSQFDLSPAPILSVPQTHTHNDNQCTSVTPGPGNLCDNDTMLKDLMAYYTPHGQPAPLPVSLRQKQTSSSLTSDTTGPEAIQLKERRADNRERKKRWREQNEERNKDNDLRCRVNKRAHILFGKDDTDAKRRWVETEFLKRQRRRRGKQRQMEAVDDVLSSTLAVPVKSSKSPSPFKSTNDASTGHLPILQDAYLSMLLNNMGTIPPEAALKLMEGLPLMEATIKNEMDDKGHALPQQLAIFLQQLQKLHASALAASPEKSRSSQEASTPSSPSTSTPSTPSSPMVTTPNRPTIPQPVRSPSMTPVDLTAIQEPVGAGNLIAPSSSSLSSSSSPSPSPAPSESPQHIPPVQDGLSAMLIQSLQRTASSYQVKQEYTIEPLSPATTECSKQETSHHFNRLYSTEAVMKLMQMNLEWTRQ